MSLAQLWAALALLLPVLAAFIANLSSVDLAYHLRAGLEFLDGAGIPTRDTYTFTAAGLPWVDQQWGAQVILATVYQLAGWTGLVVLRAVLVGLLFGLVFAACRLQGADLRRAAWLTLGAFIVSAVALGLRPQLFGMVLLALTLVIVAGRRRWPRAIWLVVPIVVVWANVHGSFFLGPVVVGLAWLEDVHDRRPAAWQTLAAAVVAALAAFVNPFGPAVWGYALGLSTNALVTARITEWQPTTLRTVPGMLFFGSALAVAALLARRTSAVSWPTLAWLAVFFLIGAYAIRGVAWWPLGATVAVAALLARPEPAPTVRVARGLRRVNAVIVAALVVVVRRPPPGVAPSRSRSRCAGRRRRPRAAGCHDQPARDRRPGRPPLQPAAVGFVVRAFAAGPAGRDRLPDRGVSGGRLGRLRGRRLAAAEGWEGDPRRLGRDDRCRRQG